MDDTREESEPYVEPGSELAKLASLVVPLRMGEEELAGGDRHVHGEVSIDMQPHEPLIEVSGTGVPPLIPAGAGET